MGNIGRIEAIIIMKASPYNICTNLALLFPISEIESRRTMTCRRKSNPIKKYPGQNTLHHKKRAFRHQASPKKNLKFEFCLYLKKSNKVVIGSSHNEKEPPRNLHTLLRLAVPSPNNGAQTTAKHEMRCAVDPNLE